MGELSTFITWIMNRHGAYFAALFSCLTFVLDQARSCHFSRSWLQLIISSTLEVFMK